MLQIKIVSGMTAEELTEAANEFLSTILDDDAVKDIDTSAAAEGHVTIKYIVKNAWDDQMCGDCCYWDDNGNSEALSGLCHECGGYRRYSCKACSHFRDVRKG